MARLPLRTRLGLTIQRRVGQALGVLWIPLAAFVLRVVLGYRVRNVAEVRRQFRELVKDDRPLLICANHLTMVDSALVAWALGGSWWYLFNYRRMPWNLPERANFASNWLNRFAAWMTKCIPVSRGGSREKVSSALERVRHVLSRGETALVFPEGGRSRTGRVEPESAAYGVGRLFNSVPDCRTLCVYLRGDRQETWSTVPPRGDWFSVRVELFEPRTENRGLRGARDIARQIVEKLHLMESEHLLENGNGTGALARRQ